jgi:hypothetical protein
MADLRQVVAQGRKRIGFFDWRRCTCQRNDPRVQRPADSDSNGPYCPSRLSPRIEPSPERSNHTKWSTFLKAHWNVLSASDFFTVEVWTGRGLVSHYLLFVISLVSITCARRRASG